MLKITSGLHRGRILSAVPGNSTRPTQERLRQAWLNSLQMFLQDARVLDLFSGSGALGLEALSRGALFVQFVEENPKAFSVIQKNIQSLSFQDSTQVWCKRVESALPLLVEGPPFDLIFLDPPYHQGFEEKLLTTWPWDTLVTESGRICVESAYRKQGGYDAPSGWTISRDERYGDSQLTFYSRADNASETGVP